MTDGQDLRQYQNKIKYYPETLWDTLIYYYNGISAAQLFGLLILFIILIWYYQGKVIGFILFLIIAGLYLIKNEKTNAEIENMQKVIYPKSRFIEQDPELVAFMFSIQEFYDYNPGAFYKAFVNLDEFLRVYDAAATDLSLSGSSYQILLNKKADILNKLQAVIYTCPDDAAIINKLNEALTILENILNKYLIRIVQKNNEYIKQTGINNRTFPLNDIKAPIPANSPINN